ncbi:MAG TPA: MFS transporter [Stellaceae bacterium]|nr:MFS transporter [Stellaceae bacterium]
MRACRSTLAGERTAPGAPALLASQRFGPFFATQFLSAFNDSALKNALVLMIAYGAAGRASAQLLIPLAGGLFILPFFLCSATAGQITDQTDKAALARLIKLVEIPVMLAAAAGVLAGNAGLLLALLLAMGIEAAFFGPLKYAILLDLLAPEELVLGNALVEAGTFLAILLGTIAGMLIAARHGAAAVAVLLVAVSCAAWVASLFVLAVTPAAARRRARWNLAAATAEILRETARDKLPFRAMLGISWFWLAGATYLSQFPAYVRFTLGAREGVVTLFLIVFSVGIALGSLLCSRILRGRLSARIIPWGALGIGLCSVDLWLASPRPSDAALVGFAAFLTDPAHWRILLDLLGISLAGGVFIVPLYTLLQITSAPERRARVIAANNVVNAGAMALSAILTMALLAAGLSVAGLFLLTGTATLFVALLFRLALPGFSTAPALVAGDRA